MDEVSGKYAELGGTEVATFRECQQFDVLECWGAGLEVE